MISTWPLGIHIGHRWTSGCGMKNVRNDGTRCASYYGAFQNLMYLWSTNWKEFYVSHNIQILPNWIFHPTRHQNSVYFTKQIPKTPSSEIIIEFFHIHVCDSSATSCQHWHRACLNKYSQKFMKNSPNAVNIDLSQKNYSLGAIIFNSI